MPKPKQIEKWFGNGNKNCIAVVCGAVSGNLEVLDFDCQGEKYMPFMAIIKKECHGLIKKIVIEKTQSGGYHIIYRTKAVVPGNHKLSQRGVEVSGPGEHEYKGKKHKAVKVEGKWYIVFDMIETRGERGYFLCAPSDGYKLIQGDMCKLPVLSEDERNLLISTAKSLNEWVVNNDDGRTHNNSKEWTGKGIFEDYNDKNSILALLKNAGWIECGKNDKGIQLKRPGKTKPGPSGTVIDGKIFYNFSTNAYPFEAEKAYSASGVYAILSHNGNYSDASKALYKQGYGDRQQQKDPDIKEKKRSAVQELNEKYALVKISGQVLAMEIDEDGEQFIKTSDLAQWLKNQVVYVPKEDGTSKKVKTYDLWMESPERRQYRKIVFKPGIKQPDDVYNLWHGFAVKPTEGDWSLMEKHIFKYLCNGDIDQFNWFLKWCAGVVYHCLDCRKNRRPEVAIVLKGMRGIGKDTFCDLFGQMFGRHYACVTQKDHLLGKFNSSLQNCVLCHASETFWAGDKAAEGQLKAIITNKEMHFEAKYRNNILLESHINLIISSNDEWVVPAGAHERRFFVPTLAEKKPDESGYFQKLRDQWNKGGMAAMLYDLIHHVEFTENDFRQPLQTDGLKQQTEITMTLEDQFWSECLDENIELNWGDRMASELIYNKFVNFCDKIGHKKRIDRHGTFIKKLKKSANCLESTRFRDSMSTLVRGIILPPIDEAKTAFNERFGMVLYD